MARMRGIVTLVVLISALAACGGAGGGTTGPPNPSPAPPIRQLYQPLATGDSWVYTCHNTQNKSEQPYAIKNSVLGTAAVGGKTVYEFSLQIPSSPTQSTTVV